MKRAFTLIELLVVIAIIAILAAILFPVFTQAKIAAKKTCSVSNIKQLELGNQLYMTSSDDTLPPLYTFDYAQAYTPSSYGFLYWGNLLQPYMKNRDVLLCPMENVDGPALHGFNGKGGFDKDSDTYLYVAGANSSYGMNYRYMNNQVTKTPAGPGDVPYAFEGISQTAFENVSQTVNIAEATMKDKPAGALSPTPTYIKNPVGYARIEPPFGDAATGRLSWAQYRAMNAPPSGTYPDARGQGQIWPRFQKDTVIVGWLDGHVKAFPVKKLEAAGTTKEEVDRYFNGKGE